jgi:hypothetical protein
VKISRERERRDVGWDMESSGVSQVQRNVDQDIVSGRRIS